MIVPSPRYLSMATTAEHRNDVFKIFTWFDISRLYLFMRYPVQNFQINWLVQLCFTFHFGFFKAMNIIIHKLTGCYYEIHGVHYKCVTLRQFPDQNHSWEASPSSSQEVAQFLLKRKDHFSVRKSPPLDPTASQLNRMNASYVFKIIFILPSPLSLIFRLFVCILRLFHPYTCPTHLILLDLIPVIFYEEQNLWLRSLRTFVHWPGNCSLAPSFSLGPI